MALEMSSASCGWATDVGCVRELNEDAVIAAAPIFAVADGMGGHAAGEVASAIAVDHLATLVGRDDVQAEDVLNSVDEANASILIRAERDVEAAGMGTTLSGVCLGTVGGSLHWYVFNVGDSRVYRLADGRATQLTVDHSEVGELLAAGMISATQAAEHPLRNVVTRSLGTSPSPTTDMWVVPAEPGDTFVVCSDGLTNELTNEEITEITSRHVQAQDAAEALVARAVAAGGRDNVSVIVIALPGSVASVDAEVTAPRPRLNGAGDG